MNWLTGRRLPRWAGVAVPVAAFPAVHALLPWALSVLGTRHGWAGGRPGIPNFVGLIPAAAGFYIAFLCSREHFLAAREAFRNALRLDPEDAASARRIELCDRLLCSTRP